MSVVLAMASVGVAQDRPASRPDGGPVEAPRERDPVGAERTREDPSAVDPSARAQSQPSHDEPTGVKAFAARWPRVLTVHVRCIDSGEVEVRGVGNEFERVGRRLEWEFGGAKAKNVAALRFLVRDVRFRSGSMLAHPNGSRRIAPLLVEVGDDVLVGEVLEVVDVLARDGPVIPLFGGCEHLDVAEGVFELPFEIVPVTAKAAQKPGIALAPVSEFAVGQGVVRLDELGPAPRIPVAVTALGLVEIDGVVHRPRRSTAEPDGLVRALKTRFEAARAAERGGAADRREARPILAIDRSAPWSAVDRVLSAVVSARGPGGRGPLRVEWQVVERAAEKGRVGPGGR